MSLLTNMKSFTIDTRIISDVQRIRNQHYAHNYTAMIHHVEKKRILFKNRDHLPSEVFCVGGINRYTIKIINPITIDVYLKNGKIVRSECNLR
jgi:hypothetical protein